MSPTVDSLLPLSFLEAVRNVDTPDDDPDTELVAELRNKRLGLSDTVYAQIRRYSDAVKRSQRTVRDEAVALARLIGRRPDAEAVFRAAGRHLANEAYLSISPMTRRIMLTLPSFIARPIALLAVMLVLVGAPLTLSSVSVGARAVVEGSVLPVANEWADAHGWAITDVSWQGTELIVRAEGPLPVPTTDELKAELDAAGIDTDRVTVNLVPIYKVELQ